MVRQGKIRLAERKKKTPKSPRHLVWNWQLNAIAYDLVHKYAHRIWPDQREAPPHLSRTARPGRPYMRATRANMRVTQRAAKRLRDSGVKLTAQNVTLESLIGLCVRDYLRCLMETGNQVPAEQTLDAKQLLEMFLSIDIAQPSQPPASNLLPTTSDIPSNMASDMDEGSEEGEIVECPSGVPSDMDEGSEEGEMVERPKRKLPDTINTGVESEKLPRSRSSPAQQTRNSMLETRQNPDLNFGIRYRRFTAPNSEAVASHLRICQGDCLSAPTQSTQETNDTSGEGTTHSSLNQGGDVMSAAADNFPTGPRGTATRDNVGAYRCLLQNCIATFHTLQELDQHALVHHNNGSRDPTDTYTAVDGVSRRHWWPELQNSADPVGQDAREPEREDDRPAVADRESSPRLIMLAQSIEDPEYAEVFRRQIGIRESW